jgi:hypothetical protein
LRFSRDKRGYENTFVVHTGRRRGRSRSKILYWFRTPPGVRVGRAALDEDAIRLIEAHNPDVEFDWTRILKGQGAPAPETKGATHREAPARPPGPAAARPQSHRDVDSPPLPLQQPALPEPARETSEPDLSAGVQDVTEALAVPTDQPPTAAEARLGSEGLLRLRARYAEVLARISERITEPSRQEQLKAEAERLNPDTWVTDAEVSAGLEQYEQVFESLRGVVGRQRKRRSQKRVQGREAASVAPGDAVAREQEDTGDEPGSAGDL